MGRRQSRDNVPDQSHALLRLPPRLVRRGRAPDPHAPAAVHHRQCGPAQHDGEQDGDLVRVLFHGAAYACAHVYVAAERVEPLFLQQPSRRVRDPYVVGADARVRIASPADGCDAVRGRDGDEERYSDDDVCGERGEEGKIYSYCF